MKAIIAAACLAALSGCATNKAQIFVGAGGETRNCWASGWGYQGTVAANHQFDACTKHLQAAGFLRIEDAGRIGINMVKDSTTIGLVSPGSPASKAGVTPGDRVVKVNGAAVLDAGLLPAQLFGRNGVPIELELERDGTKRTVIILRAPWNSLG